MCRRLTLIVLSITVERSNVYPVFGMKDGNWATSKIGGDITDSKKYEKCRWRKDPFYGNGLAHSPEPIHILSSPYQFLKQDHIIFQSSIPFPPCAPDLQFSSSRTHFGSSVVTFR